ncbi:MAG: hypothetical protein ACYDHF_05900 [Candidatus Cryosericum sp.]
MDDRIACLKPYPVASYSTIDIDGLVVFAAVEAHDLGIPLSLENLIVVSFKLFPGRFALDGYPEYPDATRIEKSLWRSKGKKRWLEGKTRHGYVISDRARDVFKQVRHTLGQTPDAEPIRPTKLRRQESILRDAMTSMAYNKYTTGAKDTISWGDVCYLLQGTLDSPLEMLRANLALLTSMASETGEQDLAALLGWVEGSFEKISRKSVSTRR